MGGCKSKKNEFDFSLKWMLFLVSNTCKIKILGIFILSVSIKNKLLLSVYFQKFSRIITRMLFNWFLRGINHI